mmetsp:Transcript_22590/g.55947  ORF Transcript_22590/g.55947 Transcript_22590/m.55947 type:complete len:80 (-) Transcript_22590:600-839(-)
MGRWRSSDQVGAAAVETLAAASVTSAAAATAVEVSLVLASVQKKPAHEAEHPLSVCPLWPRLLLQTYTQMGGAADRSSI